MLRCRFDILYDDPHPLRMRRRKRLRKDTCWSYSYVYSRASTWCGQGRVPIQKGGYAVTRRRERKRENVILVTPVTLSIPLWRRIRNSGDDPTTVFGDLPRASSSPRRAFTSCLFFLLSLAFSLSLPHSYYPRFSLSFHRTLSLSSISSFSFFFSFFFLYKTPYFPSVRSLSASNPPTPFPLTASLLPISVIPFREGRVFLWICTCWTSPARASIAPLFLLAQKSRPFYSRVKRGGSLSDLVDGFLALRLARTLFTCLLRCSDTSVNYLSTRERMRADRFDRQANLLKQRHTL